MTQAFTTTHSKLFMFRVVTRLFLLIIVVVVVFFAAWQLLVLDLWRGVLWCWRTVLNGRSGRLSRLREKEQCGSGHGFCICSRLFRVFHWYLWCCRKHRCSCMSGLLFVVQEQGWCRILCASC